MALTSSYRLFQPTRGHRYSVDDMLVAYVACVHSVSPTRVLDLGCGLGSVLLMLAWRFPETAFVGVEAQPEHVALARRNIALNHCEHRASIVHGDLRYTHDELEKLGPFDLITATPPYFDPQASTVCSNPQRAYAQWEYRGGIEDYVSSASRLLATGGRFVTCSSSVPLGRTQNALRRAGIEPVWRRDVLPRPGRPPFLSLWIAQHNDASDPVEELPLLLRNSDGTRTLEHIQIREWFGIPCGLR